jgi:hypothetical protein
MKAKWVINLDSILNIEALTLSVFLLMSGMVLSCSSKKGNETANTPGNFVELADNSDYRNFHSLFAIPQSHSSGYQSYLEERFGSSCQVVRNSRGQIVQKSDFRTFDETLDNSDVILYSLKYQNQFDTFQSDTTLQIRNAQGNLVRLFRTNQSLRSQQSGGELLQLPLTVAVECTGPLNCPEVNPPNEARLRSILNEVGFAYYLKNKTLKPANCRVQSTGQMVANVSKGRMKLYSGQDVEAYQTIESDFGPVYCNGSYMGQGESKRVSIHSLAVKPIPGIDGITIAPYFSCGGSLIAQSQVIKLNNKIVDTFRFEVNQTVLK